MIFSNTTPLIALAGVRQLDLLSALFGEIHVVETVIDECAAGGPIAVPNLRNLGWVRVVKVLPANQPGVLLDLDRGERDTLTMAQKMGAARVIIDERIGRNIAELIGLHVVGTLGILLKAKEQGLIASFGETVARMRANGIHYHPALVSKLTSLAGENA